MEGEQRIISWFSLFYGRADFHGNTAAQTFCVLLHMCVSQTLLLHNTSVMPSMWILLRRLVGLLPSLRFSHTWFLWFFLLTKHQRLTLLLITELLSPYITLHTPLSIISGIFKFNSICDCSNYVDTLVVPTGTQTWKNAIFYFHLLGFRDPSLPTWPSVVSLSLSFIFSYKAHEDKKKHGDVNVSTNRVNSNMRKQHIVFKCWIWGPAI